MSLLRVQWLVLRLHTNRCTHTLTQTQTHGLDSHLFTEDFGNDGRLNVADGILWRFVLFKSFFSLPFLSRSFKKSVQGQAAAWAELASDFWSDNRWKGACQVRKSECRAASPRQRRCVVWGSERVVWASFEFPLLWISKGRRIKHLTAFLMKTLMKGSSRCSRYSWVRVGWRCNWMIDFNKMDALILCLKIYATTPSPPVSGIATFCSCSE